MTEQTEGAEVETLAKVLGDIRVAEARQADWWTDDAEHSLLIRVLRGECVPWAAGLLTSDWLAAREAAAEVRGAQAVLAAVEAYVAEVEANAAEHQHLPRLDRDVLRARAAAAVTTSSAKSSDLATRVPQDESQRAAGGGAP